MNANRKRLLYSLAMLVAAGGLLGFALTEGPFARTGVELDAVTRGDLQPDVFGIGTVEARVRYGLGPDQAGRVLRVLVDEGDTVRAGQVVGEMDPVDLEQRIAAARFSEQRAQRAADAAAEALAQAAERLALADRTAARYVTLQRRGLVSLQSTESMQTDAAVGRAAQAAAQAELQVARRELARASAEREGLEARRANLQLVSPIDALVVSRDAEPGATVVAGQAVLQLVDPASVWIEARINEARAGEVRVGQSARVVLRSRGDEVLPAQVARVELESDRLTEERRIAVGFAQLPKYFHLGEQAEVTIELPVRHDVLTIPGAALQRRGGQDGVWQVVDGRIGFRAVRVGARGADGRVQVLDGLSAGERVVVYSAVALEPGERVRERERL